MAVYEYQCPACGVGFEVARPMSQADRPTPCPRCGRDGHRLLSVFAHSDGSRLVVPDGPFRQREASSSPPMKLPAPAEAGPPPGPPLVAMEQEQRLATVEKAIEHLATDHVKNETALIVELAEVGQHLLDLNQRHDTITQRLSRLEEALAALSATGLKLRDERALTTELAEIDHHLEDLVQRDSLAHDRLATLDTAVADLATKGVKLRDEEALARELGEIDGHLAGLELSDRGLTQHLASLRKQLDGLAGNSVMPAQLSALRDELIEAVKGSKSLPGDLGGRLLAAVERLEGGQTWDSQVSTRKQELAGLDAELERLRRECERLNEERGALETQLSAQRERVQSAITKATEDASTSITQWAQLLRRELDGLLRETLDLAGKAAEVDGDLRGHEWLNRLLALTEGRDHLTAKEVAHLASTVLGAVQTWNTQHKGFLAENSRADLERLLRSFQGMDQWTSSAST